MDANYIQGWTLTTDLSDFLYLISRLIWAFVKEEAKESLTFSLFQCSWCFSSVLFSLFQYFRIQNVPLDFHSITISWSLYSFIMKASHSDVFWRMKNFVWHWKQSEVKRYMVDVDARSLRSKCFSHRKIAASVFSQKESNN